MCYLTVTTRCGSKILFLPGKAVPSCGTTYMPHTCLVMTSLTHQDIHETVFFYDGLMHRRGGGRFYILFEAISCTSCLGMCVCLCCFLSIVFNNVIDNRVASNQLAISLRHIEAMPPPLSPSPIARQASSIALFLEQLTTWRVLGYNGYSFVGSKLAHWTQITVLLETN